jgi:hypothetical protein
MKMEFLCLLVLGLVFFTAQNASAVFLEFEDLSLGATYGIGESFTTGVYVDVTVEQLEYPAAILQVVPAGYVEVVNPGEVIVGSENELKISNAMLNFLFDFQGRPSCGLMLFFVENGEFINLGVNGQLLYGGDFADLNGQTINGAKIDVLQSMNQGALMVVSGCISSFQVGGEDLYIDDMFVCEVPEPMTIVLLGLGGLSLLARNRKRS